MRYFLLVKKRELCRYAHQADRDYFSKPVEVIPEFSNVSTRLLFVFDPNRNCRFPMLTTDLKAEYQLTNKQRVMVAQ